MTRGKACGCVNVRCAQCLIKGHATGEPAEPTVALPSEFSAFINRTLSPTVRLTFLSHGLLGSCICTSVYDDVDVFFLKYIEPVQEVATYSTTDLQCAFFIPQLLMLRTWTLRDVVEEKNSVEENTYLYKLNLLSLTDMHLVRHVVIL